MLGQMQTSVKQIIIFLLCAYPASCCFSIIKFPLAISFLYCHLKIRSFWNLPTLQNPGWCNGISVQGDCTPDLVVMVLGLRKPHKYLGPSTLLQVLLRAAMRTFYFWEPKFSEQAFPSFSALKSESFQKL